MRAAWTRTLWIGLLMALLAATAVKADQYSSAYLQLQQTSEDSFAVLWKVPAVMLSGGQKPRPKFPADVTVSALHSQLVAGVLTERSSVTRSGGLAGATVEIAGMDRAVNEVLVRIEHLDGSAETARLSATANSFQVAVAAAFFDTINTYLRFGIEHILSGFDHLLLVACLIFIAGVSAQRWRRLLLTITGFTVAHSLTLTAAALDLLQLPMAAIEACIALSIVFLAREIMLDRRDTLTWRYPVVVSVVFGLLHGFGFASALSEIGLPQGEIPAALLAFNIGVEIGQLAFVALLLLSCFAFAQCFKQLKASPSAVLVAIEKPVAMAVGTIAMFWTIERIWGL